MLSLQPAINWLRVSIRIGVAFLKENEGLGEWGVAKRAMR
jgi:hypothetical protein